MTFKTLRKNIKYLYKNNIKDILLDNMLDGIIEERIIEYIENFPKIMTIDDTISYIKQNNSSLARFGDGEMALIYGENIPFQAASKLLSDRLIEVLSADKLNFEIGIPKFIYSSKKHLIEISQNFWTANGKKFRDIINPYLNLNKYYLAAEFTIADTAYKKMDREKYYSSLKEIWKNKDITIICGKTVFDDIKYNIYDEAKSVEYQYAPAVNAFDDYNNILEQALKIDKNRKIIIILGPTAKVLAYDLFLNGYVALDMGHVAKQYDWYMKGHKINNMSDAVEFFNPD